MFLMLMMAGNANVLAADRLQLESTSIIGTKELPKILYIVPWKNTQLSALGSVSDDGSFDSSMVPLDRFVFRREIKYQQMLQGESENVSP